MMSEAEIRRLRRAYGYLRKADMEASKIAWEAGSLVPIREEEVKRLSQEELRRYVRYLTSSTERHCYNILRNLMRASEVLGDKVDLLQISVRGAQ
jgi:hypothetical protein